MTLRLLNNFLNAFTKRTLVLNVQDLLIFSEAE